MKELIGMEIEWNETVEISLSFNGVTSERREKRYYLIDSYQYEATRFGKRCYEYVLIALDGTCKKRKVSSIIIENEYKRGNIKIAS